MFLVIILYYTIAVIYEINTIKKYFITPGFIFVGMQIVMFSGVLTYSNFNILSDCKLVFVYLTALLSFIYGDFIGIRCSQVNNQQTKVDADFRPSQYQCLAIASMVIVSVLACLYFFLSSGYNVFLMILQSISSEGGAGDFTESRIAMNNISGVGYIYQFRVVILPVLTAYLVTSKESALLHKIGILVAPLMVVFVLGTGQRGGFVMFVLIWLVSLLYIYKYYRDQKIRKLIIFVCTGAFCLFFIMTIFNGRVREGGTALQAVLQRIFDDNQQCAVIAFRYIDSQPCQFGRDWWLSIKDILPGKNSYLQLSYVVFSIMYGSTRGTAPPCIWGSVYFNWGFIGIMIVPIIMGFMYRKLYVHFVNSEKNKLSIFVYSAMFVILGNWIADTPLVLFNQGFITICLMKEILRINPKFRLGDRKY